MPGLSSRTPRSSPDRRALRLQQWLLALLAVLIGVLWWSETSQALRVLLGLVLLACAYVLLRELQTLWATQRAYRLAMEAAHDGFWEWNPRNKRLNVGNRLLEILGYRDNFLGDTHAWLELVHPDDRAHYNRTVGDHLKGRTPFFYCEYRVRASDGQYRWIASRGIAVRNRAGIAYQMAGSVTDITERKQHEEEVAFLARHDPLTGLPNRFLLAERLIETMTGDGKRVGLLFIDLDRFKDINDSLGHRLGDHLLQDVARRLAEVVSRHETLIRQGGDEFIVLMPAVDDAGVAEKRAAAILAALEKPFETDGQLLHVGASIGLSLHPDDAEDAEQLLRNADTAMYVAKRQGGGQVARHTPDMKARVLERATIEARLRRAIDRRAFVLHYQPQFDTLDGRLVGAEALLRWPEGDSWTPPDRFIPIAEETGLIVAIGDWVLDTAIRQLAEWQRQHPQPLRMAINLSARQFWQADLPERIAVRCGRYGLAAERIELEVTESIMLQADGKHVDLLYTLRGLGFRLALDDFGTGYSSLSYLHRLPFTSLKIDRSFVSALADDGGREGSSTLVPTIIAMAHSLGLEVVAEGVENAAQRQALRQLGCDVHQGFLDGRPVGAEEFQLRWLSTAGNCPAPSAQV
ncbi:MAG: EAL domain-containing protein [Azonexaceae bacterium]|nr:EAL domain-containing protein [Azonexaceae bacterium]